jgi:ribose transport system ATP-binding protein
MTKDAHPVSFDVRRGEILGMFGMVGSGRTEIARAISGADGFHSGRVAAEGRPLRLRSPRTASGAGFAHITEDRQRLGLNLNASVLENTLMVGLGAMRPRPYYNFRAWRPGEAVVESLRIKTPSLMQAAVNLSGGNQQKVVLGKWLYARQSFYIFDEPHRASTSTPRPSSTSR